MASLTSKQESFIKTMGKGEEFARHGFDLLAKRSDPEKYFDALSQEGFFDPANNPNPKPSTEPGFVQVPFWTALKYLESIARRAQELEDLGLARKVLDVVRAVTEFRNGEGDTTDNYHTFWQFAAIIGLLPLKAISLADINLVPLWLTSKFDKGLVGRELSKGILPRLLATSDAEEIEKACLLLEHCTEVVRPHTKGIGKEFVTVVDDYWLKELINQHAATFGEKAGARTVGIFERRLKYIYGELKDDFTSSLRRPAIEDSPQNLDWHGPDNRLVEGLRDSLVSWLDSYPQEATEYVAVALGDQFEIIRRLSLYVITERFELLRPTFEAKISAALFISAHRHELYRLLRTHFSQFSEDAKKKSVKAIWDIPASSSGEDKAERLRRTQRDWLSALDGSGYEPAEQWLKELMSEKTLGGLSEHPDFLTYHEFRSGPGPTPFSSLSLLAYAEDGSLIDRLNGFKQADSWTGPTVGGLVEELQSVVAKSPDVFISILSSFHAAKLPFQYAVLNGFKAALDSNSQTVNRAIVWPKILKFILELLSDETFWLLPGQPEGFDRTPTPNWMVHLAADFVSLGTKHDENAYDPELLPLGRDILSTLLAHVPPEDGANVLSDPMFHALNTPKGRVIDAVVNHALRVCRLSARNTNSTLGGWNSVRAIFDEEILQCRGSNFEFSTLMGAYVANVHYMSQEWLTENVSHIFPTEFAQNFLCAVGGLAFATPTRPTYRLLSGQNVFLRALDTTDRNQIKHEKIVEWISLSYLWEDEQLDSPNILRLFKEQEYLRVAVGFFWQVRGDNLTGVQIDRILKFWEVCNEWAKNQPTAPAQFYSHLSRLAVFIHAIDAREKGLLLDVAPHVHLGYNFDTFVGELLRLLPTNTRAVSEILMISIRAGTPTYDYQDKLKTLILDLARLGLKAEAIRCVEALGPHFPGKIELYKSL